MKQTLRDLAEKLGCRLLGDNSITVTSVSSLQSATIHSLVFVEDAQYLAAALRSSAAAVIVGEFVARDAATGDVAASTAKPILISAQPRLAFARAAKLLHDPDRNRGIHPSAIVPASAEVGENVAIGPRAILGAHVKIGDETTIGPGSIIGSDGGETAADYALGDHTVRIGSHCRLDANVTVYPGTTLGDRVIVQAGAVLGSAGFGYVRDSKTGRYEQAPQIGRLVIEDDVEIGANSSIDRGALDETRIRRGTKIDNLVHIGHNCQIGENVIIAAQTGLSGSVTIEDDVVMGGQVGIGDHARVEAGAMIGGQGGILPKKILRGKGVVFWGTPARPLREYLKELAFVSRAAKKGR
jgi:UDP-3-O-[3-hydroxymyristoyl] glucosamine N-acyltransferase